MSSKRSIFEEVSEAQRAEVRKPNSGLIDAGRSRWRKPARLWMMILWAMVAVMILVGGLTRLTDSGLSITEWKPVSGALPPMNAADWEVEFEKYRQIPEYQLQNKGMSLAEFKRIYWWEWGHRQLGRVIGLVWFAGFLYLLLAHRLRGVWLRRALILGALGGLQGAIGWWMVSSGLTGRMVDVASYRLATHLGLAFVILGLLAWYIWQLGRSESELIQSARQKNARVFKLARVLTIMAFFQILLGALVAGIDAGRGYIDWPLMGGEFLPSESFDYTPFWSNFFENPALVQFNHRILGYLILLKMGFVWWITRRSATLEIKQIGTLCALLVLLQMVIGIFTVLYAAPLNIAILHQFGAILVWTALLRLCFVAAFPNADKLRG